MNTLKRLLIALTALSILFLSACSSRFPSPTVRTVDDVEGKLIGVVAGSSAEHFAANYGEVRTFASTAAMLAELRAGSLDCALIEDYNLDAALKGESGVRAVAEPLCTLNFSIIAAKQSRDLTADINSAIRTLTNSTILPSIIGNYTDGKPYKYTPRTDIPETAGTLRLAVGGTFAEYLKRDERGGYSGLDIDVIRAVCDQLGVNIEIIELDSSKIIDHVWSGKADFAIGAMCETPERLEKVDFSNPYTTVELRIITRK